MHPDGMKEIRSELLARAAEIMERKQKEYSTPTNCMANFDAISKDMGEPPMMAIATYMSKPVRAVLNLAHHLQSGGNYHVWKEKQTESLMDRLADIINYAVFAAVEEHRVSKGKE